LLDAFGAAGVRRVLYQILRTAIVVFEMIILLLVYVLIWSVLAFYFFGPAATKTAEKLQESSYFDTFDRTYVSLFVAITTANYPDVTMVSYHNNYAAALFFVLYVGLGLYFVLNLFLAMVRNASRDELEYGMVYGGAVEDAGSVVGLLPCRTETLTPCRVGTLTYQSSSPPHNPC
jgi:hypothetical protein